MIDKLLRLFPKEMLWKEVIRRETFEKTGEIEAASIWSHVYSSAPELSGFLKKREIDLLKGSALQEKPSLFVLGQIAENRLWQHYDTIKQNTVTVSAPKPVQTLKSLDEILRARKVAKEKETK